MFKGILIEKDDAGYRANLAEIDEAQLPDGDVTVAVQYSTLNYKDGLAITGKGPVVRKFPMVPGIDLVGTVEASSNPDCRVGDAVVLNGWGVGEGHWGGLAQKARLKGGWLVPLPTGFTPKQAMSIGTAGYTAMLCVMALERHGVTPDKGEVLVTGANGGVGSVAVAVLARCTVCPRDCAVNRLEDEAKAGCIHGENMRSSVASAAFRELPCARRG